MPAVEFDRVAGIYDETRRGLEPETLGGILRALASHGCRTVLEIGVGTGRVGVPLQRAGVQVTGVDLSRGMIERARAKGLLDLVLGDGLTAPFRSGSFDAVFVAHVLHIVARPWDLVREGSRLGRVGVFALVRDWNFERWWWFPTSGPSESPGERREWLRKLGEKWHWSWEESRSHDWARERDLLKTNPPDELVLVSDLQVSEPLETRIARIQKGAYSVFEKMPQGMRDELVAEIRRRGALSPAGPRREAYRLAFWRSDALRGPGAQGP